MGRHKGYVDSEEVRQKKRENMAKARAVKYAMNAEKAAAGTGDVKPAVNVETKTGRQLYRDMMWVYRNYGAEKPVPAGLGRQKYWRLYKEKPEVFLRMLQLADNKESDKNSKAGALVGGEEVVVNAGKLMGEFERLSKGACPECGRIGGDVK